MTRIAVSRLMAVPHDRVWGSIADLESHTSWMKDAKRIAFVGDQRRGEGTRVEVRTALGPFRTIDVMEVVGWHEGRSIEVSHRGLVKGAGTLSVTPHGGQTLVGWVEELTFPWWLGGRLAGWLARPILAGIWRASLRRLESSLSDP